MRVVATVFLGLLNLLSVGAPPEPTAHQKLRVVNDFASPSEVVAYYAARDASGFVWSGLLDVERRAFTTWSEAPAQDTFYVASSYSVGTPKVQGDQATVEVRYQIEGVSDAHGTLEPARDKTLVVTYTLVRGAAAAPAGRSLAAGSAAAAWKISKPEATEVSPIVMRNRFPLVGPAARGLARR